MSETEEEYLRRQARYAGLIAGAVHRGDVWPVGTLVRWAGKNSKVIYRITDIRTHGAVLHAAHGFDVQCTPLHPGPGRSTFWTDCEYLRQVSE